jgi:hypothetical protein
LFETDCDAAHTDLVIHYNTKSRPRVLYAWSDTFTASGATLTLADGAGNFNWVTGDGPFTVANSGGALPTGLSAATNYWIYFDASDPDAVQLATSKANALNGTTITTTDAGTGTHTMTMAASADSLPYDGIFDEFIREMLVAHAKSKKQQRPSPIYHEAFRRRAMEEVLRRQYVPKPYVIDY